MEKPALRTQIKIVAIVLFWGIFAAGYFGRLPMTGFFSQLTLMSLALVVVAAAYGYGSIAVQQCLPDKRTSSETVLFSIVAGFGFLRLAMVLAGTLALWTHRAAFGLVCGGLVLAWINRMSVLYMCKPDDNASEPVPRAPV